MKSLLDDSASEDSDSDSGVKLNINEEFARRFEHNKKRAERHKLEEKYGPAGKDDDESETSSEDESEDDYAELATGELDAVIEDTLKAIRSKDPRVYDADHKFYPDIEPEGETKKVEKEKPMYLKDYHMKNLLEGGGEGEAAPRTYVQEQADIKQSIVQELNAAVDGDDSEEDNFLVRKSKPEPQRALPIPDPSLAEREPETFLSNFMASRAWVPGSSSRFQALESDDEEEEARAEAFEIAYNLRFEDPNLSNQKLMTHARDAVAKNTVRREEKSSRKKVREREQEKKEERKRERELEKARLKKLRIEEMEEKVKLIREAAGAMGKAVNLEEWADVLEQDFDSSQWDEEMQRRFGKDYYDGGEQGSDSEVEEAEKKHKKPKKPQWDDDIDIKDLVPEFAVEEAVVPPVLSDEDAEEEKVAQNHKKALADAKSAARRDRRLIEALVDQTLPLTTADASSASVAPFRYRETSPTTFGLTAADILAADDAQLNQFVGLKKLAAFRDPQRKSKDKKKLGKKARLRQWRKETFGREDGPPPEAIFDPNALQAINEFPSKRKESSATAGAPPGEEKAKRKRKKKSKDAVVA
ncbi:Krr1-domain-containing protein [Trichodelitschia bisporula]|uniref:Krr1-domain-containing protein n=1 Tax=Trichodelitschia bisporula TaxID=703511 RepID=A0A6G1HWA3_9PEZI|nr:Krr1-domain-containing protein [Trichodelitschia bisporula]